MRNKALLTKAVFLLGIALIFSGLVLAQEEESVDSLAIQKEEILYISFGEVVSVSGDMIVVKEYDSSLGAEGTSVSYLIDSDTEFVNVDSVDEIQAGDNVDIDYVVKDGEQIARIIRVESELSEEESSSEDISK